jgi:hypothetical protein
MLAIGALSPGCGRLGGQQFSFSVGYPSLGFVNIKLFANIDRMDPASDFPVQPVVAVF